MNKLIDRLQNELDIANKCDCHAVIFEFKKEELEEIIQALKLASVAQEMATMLDKANRTYLGSEYVVCLNPKDVDQALAKFKELKG